MRSGGTKGPPESTQVHVCVASQRVQLTPQQGIVLGKGSCPPLRAWSWEALQLMAPGTPRCVPLG